jgi:hypothetical protein
VAITMNLGTSSHGNGVILPENPPCFWLHLVDCKRSIGAGPPVIIQLSGWNIVKRNAGSLIDDVRRDIAINSMLTWHKLSFLIGQFEFEV